MTNEESLSEMLLESGQILESANLLEFLSANAYSWYQEQKRIGEQDFNPAEKFILDQAAGIRKK